MADKDKAVKEAIKTARSAVASKDYRTALRACEDGLGHEAQHYDLLVLKGKAHFGATSYVESESAYRQAVSADGKRVTAWQGLSELYNEQADKAAVDKIIDKVALPKLINVLKELATLFSTDKGKLREYKEQLLVAENRLNPPPEKLVVRKPSTEARKQPEKKTSKGGGAANRCSVPGCKERLNDKNTYKCKDCGRSTCVEHQYPIDHECEGAKPAAPAVRKPAAPNGGIQVLTKKKLVTTTLEASAPPPAAPTAPPSDVPTSGVISASLNANMVATVALLDGLMKSNDGDIGKVMAALEQKTAITQKKALAEDREQAMNCMELLCSRLERKFEPYAVKHLYLMMQCVGDGRGGVPAAAMGAVNFILGRMLPHAITLVVPSITKGLDDRNYRVKEGSLQALCIVAHRAPVETGLAMPVLFPKLQECLGDTHPKVAEAAQGTLMALTTVIVQPETIKIMDNLKKAIVKPSEFTSVCLDQLMETTFVNSVDAASLAMLMPVVARGLKEPSADLNKKAATTAGNVCALVADSRDILPFVPMLLPGLTKAVDHSHPDVRAAATRARLSLLTGSMLSDEGVITALSKASSSNDLASLEAIAAMDPQVLKAKAAASVVRKAATELLAEWVQRGKVSEQTSDYISELLVTMCRDARAAAGLAAEVKSSVWPLIHDCGAEESACDAMGTHLAKHVAAELYASSEIPDRDYIVRVEGIILAFAGKVLLSKTHLLLERNHRYGLIGQNGQGKTTLLNRVAAGDIKGFPKDTSVYYIQHEILSEGFVSVKSFMMGQVPDGTSEETIVKALVDVGFTDETMQKGVGELSGGWRMKLAIARSMLWNARILLLDEPTNHLDKAAVAWLVEKINSLVETTVLLVSHDYDFLKQVLTDVIHIDSKKLTYYNCGFAEFQSQRPEIVAGLPSPESAIAAANATHALNNSLPTGADGERATADAEPPAEEASTAPSTGLDKVISGSTDKPIIFANPGKLEGIVGRRKVVLRMSNVQFKYDTAEKAILTDASGTLCLSSRVALIGANGAGKTTMMKLLVGETTPSEGVGEVWVHHNLRLAYIAQHSMHHLEASLENTPLEYIQNRFYKGLDKELSKLTTMALTDDEKELMGQRGSIVKVIGRQTRSGNKLWYEVLKNGRKENDTDWEPLQFLEKMAPYVLKLVRNYDEECKSAASGMALRPITAIEVRKHLGDFGIDEDLASQKIKRMSGGQRSRLVLAAANWSRPHVIALDEPTNYLDNDTLAALTHALKTFQGGVVTISHNQAFVKELCNETWLVENGTVVINKLK